MMWEIRRFPLNTSSKIKKGILLIGFFLILTIQMINKSHPSNTARILNFKDFSWDKPYFCKESAPYSEFNKSFVICGIHPAKDNYVTAVFYSYWKYEETLMELFLAGTLQYPDSIVLDIGSNIGPYTLASSILNHSVIAVDPMLRNHGHLFNSLALSGVVDKVTQILNAVSDNYSTMESNQIMANHPGRTVMFEIEEDSSKNPDRFIHSVKLEDILDLVPENIPVVMKMDVEGYECKALEVFLNSKVKKRFIPYMQLEFINICNEAFMCPGYKQHFLTGLQASGYIPYLPKKTSYKELLNMEGKLCPDNVFLVHESAKPLHILNKINAI